MEIVVNRVPVQSERMKCVFERIQFIKLEESPTK